MTGDFVEAIVTLKPGADPNQVSEWFKQRGFEVMRMRAGLLVTASCGIYEKALGGEFPELEDAARGDVSFPVTAELAASVSSIVARRLPSYRGR